MLIKYCGNLYMNFFDLPLELRNKILYKSGFQTPCAEAMTYIIMRIMNIENKDGIL